MKKNSECSGIPSGYYAEKYGATYRIKDKETGETVSFGYHQIHFPKAKLGAGHFKLIEHDGMFIPRNNLPATVRSRLEDSNTELRGYQKKVYEAYKDYNRSASGMMPDAISEFKPAQVVRDNLTNDSADKSKDDTTTEQTDVEKVEELKDEYDSGELSLEELEKKLESQTDEIDVQEVIEEVDDSEDEETDIMASRKKYVTILCARVAGVLNEETKDWHILTSYHNVSASQLSEINSVEDVKRMSHPYNLSHSDVKRLESAEKADGQDWRAKKHDLLPELVENEYGLN